MTKYRKVSPCGRSFFLVKIYKIFVKCFAGGTGHNSLTILLIFDIIISIVKVFLTIILKLLFTAGDSKLHLAETIS